SIIAVNEKWLRPSGTMIAGSTAVGVGVNYLDVCRRASATGARSAARAVVGIEGVLTGRAPAFRMESQDEDFAASGDTENRWFTMVVTPLRHGEGGAVVSHVEITERKRAELEAQRQRQHVAHLTRVSAMGELAASIAHQLNQPLTGILSNAQTARRMLDADEPDLDEVRQIVLDIIEDDRRAGKVIQHMREMLSKG